jgi:hypothetical protein
LVFLLLKPVVAMAVPTRGQTFLLQQFQYDKKEKRANAGALTPAPTGIEVHFF